MCFVWSHWTVKYWERSLTVWRYNIHYCNGSPLFLVTPNSVPIDHFNMLADSFTAYWSQGQTIHYVLVDIVQPPMGTLSLFNLYVALSRSSGQDIIRLLQDFNKRHFQRSHDVMSHNTLDCAASSHAVHVTSCTQHHCQEWILKLFEVEIDRVRSGFECGIRIRLESKRSWRMATIRFGDEFKVALRTYRRVKEITSCSLEVSDCIL